jgi:hypothetical protein
MVEKFEQPDPAQRWTSYPVTPTLSVDADQVSPIWVCELAVATKFAGTEGDVVSAAAGVVTFAADDWAEVLPALS